MGPLRDRLAGLARNHAGLEFLVLHGSRARGDAGPGSDWESAYLAGRPGALPLGPDCATSPTNDSGYCYVAGDYQADQVHPAAGALDKITSMIHERFLREPWYRREAAGAAGSR